MKKFAPLAILLGILSALFFSSAGTAQATNPSWDCINSSKIGVGVVQICSVDVNADDVVDIVVTVESLVNLTGTQITVVKNSLNDVSVLNHLNIVNDVVDVYNNDIDVDILSGNVIVIGAPCPCHS